MSETAADSAAAEGRELACEASGAPAAETMAMAQEAKASASVARRRKNLAAYGIRSELIADLCKVDVATARRWKSGTTQMPHTAAVLMSGDLGAFSAHWQGWRIQGDAIISPDGWTISRNDALSVPLLLGQINALRAEVTKYREWDDKDEQPAPAEQLPART